MGRRHSFNSTNVNKPQKRRVIEPAFKIYKEFYEFNENQKKLEMLEEEIWKDENLRIFNNKRKIYETVISKNINRNITLEEWATLQNIFKEEADNLVVQLGATDWNFSMALYVSVIIEPCYPGIPFYFKPIFSISSKQLPIELLGQNKHFDVGWDKFYELVNKDKNIKNLKRCSLDLPKNKQYYEY